MRRWLIWTLAVAGLWGCGDEPDKLVNARSADGAFELTVEGRKNSLKRGESLALKVTVESLAGQLAETVRDTITFVANAGSVSPSRLVFTFVGRDDSLYSRGGIETTYTDWVTYTMSTSTTTAASDRQGEVMALYRDLEAVYKIRIVDD